MKRFFTVKRMIVLSVLLFLITICIIASCGSLKTTPNNKTLAQIELDLLMFQMDNKIINIDTLNDREYIDLGHKFAALINTIGKVESQKIHYYRINFSRAPQTLDEMIKIILDKENNIFEWELLPWQSMAFHMYGESGEYNLKFMSADGHFEAVYNREGVLLTKDNDSKNMGTFNYAHQLADQVTHYNLDVWPYFMWNNTWEIMEFFKAGNEVAKALPIDKNEEAMERYIEYEKLLTGN
jgi:hypothetical protein